jgi:hypothetical protein
MKKVIILIFFITKVSFSKNFIPYSGFETGVYRLWESPYACGNLVDSSDLDYEIFHDGFASLCLTTWQGSWGDSPFSANISSTFNIPIDKPDEYTFSAWVKSDRKLKLNITCGEIKISADVLPEEGWKRVVGTGFLKDPPKINIVVYGNGDPTKELHAGHLWIDSLMLEKGKVSSNWEPSKDLEIGLVCKKMANIFYEDEAVEIFLIGVNGTDDDIVLNLKTSLFDCFGNEYPVENTVKSLLLKKGDLKKIKFNFPSIRKGVFRFQVLLEKSGDVIKRCEIPFYVIRRPIPDGWNPFGLYLQMTVPSMERASNLGLYWNNLLSAAGEITEWYKIADNNGNYKFDKYILKLKTGKEKYFLRYIGNISNSDFQGNFPKFAELDKEIPGGTIKFEVGDKYRYLKKSVFCDYIRKMAISYKDYISYWQIIDETNLKGDLYAEIMVESAKSFKEISPEIKVFATYPQNMAYIYLRKGEKYVDGLYDLGRDLRRVKYAVKAAEIARKDFPVFFYDCGLPFNYLSESFNGWGKKACITKETIDKEKFLSEIIPDFIERFNDILKRNIIPVGAGVRHTKGVILYHARIPGGEAQSAFDKWGHPSPSLIFFSLFNSLTAKGYSVGELGVDGWEGFVFYLDNKKYLIILKPEQKLNVNEFEIPSNLDLKQLDLWTNDITLMKENKKYISLSQPSYFYLVIPENQLEETKMFLRNVIGGLK